MSGFAEAQRAEYARAKAEFDTIAPKSCSPRVVDRLGVDERGSRRRRLKNEYKWGRMADGICGFGFEVFAEHRV